MKDRAFSLIVLGLVLLTFLALGYAGGFMGNSRAPATADFVPTAHFGFEPGDVSEWDLKRLSSRESAQIVLSPVRAGRYAVRIALAPGEIYGDAFKSELSDAYHAPFEREIWYRFSLYVPRDFDSGGANCVFGQWHNVSPPGVPGGKPPLAQRLRGEAFAITINFHDQPLVKGSDGTQVLLHRTDSLARDVWHDFVYRAVWSPSDRGRIDGWRDGRRVATYAGPLGYGADTKGPYFKMGVYCDKSPAKPVAVYFDEYARGASAAEVLLEGEKLD